MKISKQGVLFGASGVILAAQVIILMLTPVNAAYSPDGYYEQYIGTFSQARCDGQTDDTSVLTAEINRISSGQTLVLKQGATCEISAALPWPKTGGSINFNGAKIYQITANADGIANTTGSRINNTRLIRPAFYTTASVTAGKGINAKDVSLAIISEPRVDSDNHGSGGFVEGIRLDTTTTSSNGNYNNILFPSLTVKDGSGHYALRQNNGINQTYVEHFMGAAISGTEVLLDGDGNLFVAPDLENGTTGLEMSAATDSNSGNFILSPWVEGVTNGIVYDAGVIGSIDGFGVNNVGITDVGTGNGGRNWSIYAYPHLGVGPAFNIREGSIRLSQPGGNFASGIPLIDARAPATGSWNANAVLGVSTAFTNTVPDYWIRSNATENWGSGSATDIVMGRNGTGELAISTGNFKATHDVIFNNLPTMAGATGTIWNNSNVANISP